MYFVAKNLKKRRDTSGENISLLSTNTAREKTSQKLAVVTTHLKTPHEEHTRAHLFAILFFFFSLSLFSVELKEDREKILIYIRTPIFVL